MTNNTHHLSIKDIARISGVSIATVSRVLNNKGGYSAETEMKVRAVCDQYEFVSNMSAKALREARSGTIGLIVPNIQNPYYAAIAYHVESFLSEQGYSLLICNSNNTAEKEIQNFRTLIGKQVDGVLMISGRSETADYIQNRNVPVVFIDRKPGEGLNLPCICSDNIQTGAMVTEHLISRGCRNIAFVNGSHAGFNRQERKIGYLQALEKHNIRIDMNYLITYRDNEPAQFASEVAMYDFLQAGYPLDGVVASSEMCAAGVLAALNRLSIPIPEKVKVITFDNTTYSILMNPPLSSVERRPELMAEKACRVLLGFINGEQPEKIIQIIPASLVLRRSTE